MPLSIRKTSFTFTWNIANVSLCELGKDQGFCSPPLKSKTIVGTEWYLKFTPETGENGELSVEVFRRYLGKSTFSRLDYNLSFLAADGNVLQDLQIVDALKKELRCDEHLFIQRSKIVGKKKDNLLYQDALRVRFRIWTYSMEPEYCLVRTILRKRLFHWDIIKIMKKYKNESVRKIFILPSLHITLTLDKAVPYRGFLKIQMTIITTNGKPEDFAHCKIYIMGVDGKIHRELFNFFTSSGKKPLQFKLHPKFDNLYNDMLRLQLHFTFGVNEIERQEPRMVSNGNQTKAVSVLSKDISEEDLSQLYKSETFGDTTLVAGGISFQVHKSILCDSSKVFRDLFRTKSQPGDPASEGYIDCLNQEKVFYIQDLQSDTLGRMLLHIYTDTFHASQWDCTLRLYDAAFNYGIEGLKQKCQSVLMSELSISNACCILDLADTHKDQDVLQCAWNFICEHDEVVGTKEWGYLHKFKYSLATELLCDIYLRK